MPQTDTKAGGTSAPKVLLLSHVRTIVERIKDWAKATFALISHQHAVTDVTGLAEALADTDEVLLFGGIVTDAITVSNQSVPTSQAGNVMWSEQKKTFVFQSVDTGAYYAEWPEKGNYVDSQGTPYFGKLYLCEGRTYMRLGTNLVAAGGGAVLTGTCTTAAGTTEKTVTLDAGQNIPATPYDGMEIVVKFSNTNTAANPKLKVGSWTSTLIGYMNTTIGSSYKDRAGSANAYIRYMWLGDKWWFMGWSMEKDTTYSVLTAAQVTTGTETTGKLITAKVVHDYVKDQIDALPTIYTPMGSCSSSYLKILPLTTKTGDKWALPNGSVYNITDELTTDDNFVEGAGKTYPAGTNVVLVEPSPGVRKWDVLSGSVDLSGYVAKADFLDTLMNNVNSGKIVNDVFIDGHDVKVQRQTNAGVQYAPEALFAFATDSEVTSAVDDALK